jgi:hypothetical protein
MKRWFKSALAAALLTLSSQKDCGNRMVKRILLLLTIGTLAIGAHAGNILIDAPVNTYTWVKPGVPFAMSGYVYSVHNINGLHREGYESIAAEVWITSQYRSIRKLDPYETGIVIWSKSAKISIFPQGLTNQPASLRPGKTQSFFVNFNVPDVICKEGFNLEFLDKKYLSGHGGGRRVYLPLGRTSDDDSGYQKPTLPQANE